MFSTAVTQYRISETRVEKLQNSTSARRTSETRPKHVTSTLGTLGVGPVRGAEFIARFLCVWDKKKSFKHAKKISLSSACPGRVTCTFRISSTRATGVFNTLRTRLANVLGTSVNATCAFRFYELLFQ